VFVTARGPYIGPRHAGGFGVMVKLLVSDHRLLRAELADFARQAHEQVCPYSSRDTRQRTGGAGDRGCV